jgi:mannonate dehydratase
MEDPTPAENQEAFTLIRRHTTTPLAVGEVFNSLWDAKDLIQNQLVDYLRASVLGCGGITHLRRMADFAAIWQVRTDCHGATDLSPITMACALNFDLWVPNFGIQEYMRHTETTDAVFPHAYSFGAGRLHPGDAPGHGADIDEVEAAKHPYAPRQLPIARLEDGTMWSW